jgi:hypothetical protein
MPQNNISFEDMIRNDKLNFKANPAIEQRLMYHFQLKAASSKPKMNNILPLISTIFSKKVISLKIGLAALFIIIAVGFMQIQAPKEMTILTDTASLHLSDDTLNKTNDSIKEQ